MFKRLRKIALFTALLIILSSITTFAADITTLSSFQDTVTADMNARQSSFSINYTGDSQEFMSQYNDVVKKAYTLDDYLHWSFLSLGIHVSGPTGNINTTFTATYLDTAEQEAYVAKQVPVILAQIIAPNMTDGQKVKAVYDWLITHVTYDYTLTKYSAYDAIMGNSVCQGYALLMDKMLLESGVPTHIVTGTLQGEAHAWNECQIGGKWYFFDATNGTTDKTGFFGQSDSGLTSKSFVWTKSDFPSAASEYAYALVPVVVAVPVPVKVSKTYTSKRLSGYNVIDTSLAIATEFNNSTSQNVILANAYLFPDALSGSVLSKKYNAPILLVGSVSENTNTLAYIKSHLSSNGTIYLLGGTASVSDDVVNSIKTLGLTNFVRLGGADRIDTNIAIVNNLNASQGTPVIISSQINYPDSLSVSPIAAIKGYPILLSNVDSTDQRTLNAISSIKPSTIYIVGGTGVVSQAVESKLRSYSANIVRISGVDRYATSLAINNYFKLSSTTAIIASGNNFQEALSGIPLAVKTASPIILADTTSVVDQKQYLDSSIITNLYILGTTGSITDLEVSNMTK